MPAMTFNKGQQVILSPGLLRQLYSKILTRRAKSLDEDIIGQNDPYNYLEKELRKNFFKLYTLPTTNTTNTVTSTVQTGSSQERGESARTQVPLFSSTDPRWNLRLERGFSLSQPIFRCPLNCRKLVVFLKQRSSQFCWHAKCLRTVVGRKT